MEYCIRFIDLPPAIKGMTVKDSLDFYNIYINSRLSAEEQKKAIQHEMCHIARGDFYNFNAPLEQIERM